jgi:hypothetical protein
MTSPLTAESPARRRFLQAAALTSGGLWLGVRAGSGHAEVLAPSSVSDAEIRARFSVFLAIAADGVVHIMSAVSLAHLHSLSAWHLGRDCRGDGQSD